MKALVKNELRLTRKLLLIWMGIVLILCGFAYFEYLSLKESLNELTGLISNFPKILKAMFGVSGDLTSALGWYGCMYYWVTMLTNSYAVYLGVSCVAKEQAQGTAEYLFTKPVGRNKVVCAKAVACVCNLLALAVFSGLCNYFTAILPLSSGIGQGRVRCGTTPASGVSSATSPIPAYSAAAIADPKCCCTCRLSRRNSLRPHSISALPVPILPNRSAVFLSTPEASPCWPGMCFVVIVAPGSHSPQTARLIPARTIQTAL